MINELRGELSATDSSLCDLFYALGRHSLSFLPDSLGDFCADLYRYVVSTRIQQWMSELTVYQAFHIHVF
jgi:hypothetical protein